MEDVRVLQGDRTSITGMAELPAQTFSTDNLSQYRQSIHQSRLSLRQSGSGSGQSARPSGQSSSSIQQEGIDNDEELRLVIGLDYGTTHTGVGYATPMGNEALLAEIGVITNWGPQMGNSDKIPSTISYSPANPDEEGQLAQQWGFSLSDNAVAMVNTKLELDVDNVFDELDLVRSMLDGMKNLNIQYIRDAEGSPDFPWKGPEEIVTDYLQKVFEYLVQAVDVDYFSAAVRERFPVDIVMTIPTGWEYPAINSTYRALTAAGFSKAEFPRLNEVILVTEPEAAAVYTARHLKEIMGHEFLKVNECFVLCDAGGGTVDVVSYRVKQLVPTLELERIVLPTGAKCGSIYIDLEFKKWLQRLVGEDNYRKLDPKYDGKISTHAAEGEAMRKLMKAFNGRKRKFKNNSRDFKMDLPAPLDSLTINNKVNKGEFTIKESDMRSFFDVPCVNKIVEIVKYHVQRIEKPPIRRKVKNVFLVGGFAESEYLQEEIRYSLERVSKVNVRIPDTSWTAVVRGAVVVGIEKDRNDNSNSNLRTIRPIQRNYGLVIAKEFSEVDNDEKDRKFDSVTNRPMAVNQMQWLIKKGDAVISNNQPRRESQSFNIRFTENDSKFGDVSIYTYPDEDVPERFENDPALEIDHKLKWNLTDVNLREFEKRKDARNKVNYYYVPLRVDFILEGNVLHTALYWKSQKLSSGQISV